MLDVVNMVTTVVIGTNIGVHNIVDCKLWFSRNMIKTTFIFNKAKHMNHENICQLQIL
jgi:hypothetical protein